MELRETLKSKSEEGDAYITEIEVRLDQFSCFSYPLPFLSLGCSELSWIVG